MYYRLLKLVSLSVIPMTTCTASRCHCPHTTRCHVTYTHLDLNLDSMDADKSATRVKFLSATRGARMTVVICCKLPLLGGVSRCSTITWPAIICRCRWFILLNTFQGKETLRFLFLGIHFSKYKLLSYLSSHWHAREVMHAWIRVRRRGLDRNRMWLICTFT